MIRTFLAAALVVAASGGTPAVAQDRTEVGTLRCHVAGGAGFIFGSTRELTCSFETADGRIEEYAGHINRFGVDIGVTGDSYIVWGVLAPTERIGGGALAGTYAGVSAEASLGVGVGANALIGGSDETIVLQPISVQAQSGVNVATGITEIELVPVM